MTFALFVLYLALSYVNPGELFPALAPYRMTLFVAVVGLAAAVVSLFGNHAGPRASLQLWALTIFTIVAGLSLTMAEEWLGAPVFVFQRFGPSLTMFVLAVCGVTSLARLRIAASGVIVLTIVLVAQGAAAYHLGYSSRLFLLDRTAQGERLLDETAEHDMYATAVDDSWFAAAGDDSRSDVPRIRALGFMQDPNDLALAIVVALGLIGGVWRPSMRPRDLCLAAAAGALVYGVYLTHSRGGAVALLAVVWRVAAVRVGHLPAFALAVALGAGALALDVGERSIQLDESASERLVAWKEGIEMLKSEPILGIGYGRFVDHHTLTAHNSLVLCLAETGVLGAFFWVGLLVVTMIELQRVKQLPGAERLDDSLRRWAEGLQLSLVGFMAASFFLSRTFAPTLYLVVGLSAALAAIARRAGRPVPLPALPALGMRVLLCEVAAIGLVYAIVKLQFT